MNTETEAAFSDAMWVPAYGTLRRAIEYALFFLIVDRCTRLLVALLGEIPPLQTHIPTVTTSTAVALWVMLGLVVLLELRRQLSANPWTRDELGTLRPTERQLAIAGVATVMGAGVVVAGWPVVGRLTGDGRVAVGIGRELTTLANSDAGALAKVMGILGTDVGVLIAFSLGFVVLAYGLDRLTVGLAREVLYRKYGQRVGADGAVEANTDT